MKKYNLSAVLIGLICFSCNVNKAKIDGKLEKYFQSNKVEGCFTMMNNSDGKITVYNMELDTQRFLPASTFKIISSLVGLQIGRITSDKMIIKWDGVKRSPNWDRNMSMKDAFTVNNVPYFQEVVRRIGHDTMQHWIDTLSYGNKDISGPIDSFWLNNTLKISPDEQLGLMKRLYFDQLPFVKSVQGNVRTLMIQDDKPTHRLSYKAGNAFDDAGNQIGWVCGWVEENKHVYFFVTLIRTPDKGIDATSVPVNITRDILKEYGFFQGKM